MLTEIWLTFILIFMIFGSIVALELKDVLSSIIALGIVGLGVSISFLILQAPDLAIVQFLFEILALIILIMAFVKRTHHEFEPSKSNRVLAAVTAVLLLLIVGLSLSVFRLLPPFGQPLMTTAAYYLKNGAQQTGAANLVTAIVLDYRGYDTFGEVTILFTAILGTFAVLRSTAKAKHTGGNYE
jgi:multicomponent Na+:H+ antiporter subunit B